MGSRARTTVLASDLASDLVHRDEDIRILNEIFSDSLEGIVITDHAGTILDVNDAWCRFTGYSRRDVIGKNPKLLKSEWQDRESYEKMWQLLRQKGHWEGEIWDRRKDGSPFLRKRVS